MKITIDERPESSGIEVAIVCRKTDQQVLDIVARLRMFDRKVTGSADGGAHVVNAEDILYVAILDGRHSVDVRIAKEVKDFVLDLKGEASAVVSSKLLSKTGYEIVVNQ